MSENKDNIKTSGKNNSSDRQSISEQTKNGKKEIYVSRVISEENTGTYVHTIVSETDSNNDGSVNYYEYSTKEDRYSAEYGDKHRETKHKLEQEQDGKGRLRSYREEKTQTSVSQPSSLAEAEGYTDDFFANTKTINGGSYDKKERLIESENHLEYYDSRTASCHSHDQKISINKDGDIKQSVDVMIDEGCVNIQDEKGNQSFIAFVNSNADEHYSKYKETKNKITVTDIMVNQNGDIEGTKTIIKKDSENAQKIKKEKKLKNAKVKYEKMKKRADKDVKKATNSEYQTTEDYARRTAREKNIAPLNHALRCEDSETAKKEAIIIEERKTQEEKNVKMEQQITAEDILKKRMEENRIR